MFQGKVRIYVPPCNGLKLAVHIESFLVLRSLYLEGHHVKCAMVRAYYLAGDKL